jgi:hypothetical protein
MSTETSIRVARGANLACVSEDSSDVALDERLDELYRERPSAFVAGRDQLAKELRDAGDPDAAKRIKALRRPSAAAWLINAAALSSPELLEELAKASRRLGEVQARALEGDEGAVAEWREAAASEREASGAVVEAGRALAVEAGEKVSPKAFESAAETLQAAAGDPELRDRVMRGRLAREQSAPTLGIPAGTPVRRTDSGTAKRREATAARREVERLQRELDDAADREERMRGSVDRTAETLRQEKARLAEAKRETAALRRQLKAAKRKAT